MWTALGLYTLGPRRRSKRSRSWKRKNKGDRAVIIPETTFLSDPLYLPTLQEIRVQEEVERDFDDANSSVSHDSEYKKYAKFKYSMGGNLQLYEEHIALSSPKRKIQKSSHKSKSSSDPQELSPAHSEVCTESLELDSVDMIDASKAGDFAKSTDLFGTSSTSRLRASLEDLKITGHGASSGIDSIALRKATTRGTAPGSLGDNLTSCGQTGEVGQSESVKRSRPRERSSNAGRDSRDYSPIRPQGESIQAENPLGTSLGMDSQDDQRALEECSARGDPRGEKCRDEEAARREFYNEDKNKYDRTLLYVNRQRETVKAGEFSELDFEMSDLSSDVFTDSEVPLPGPLSRGQESDGNVEFYPDSPTSEYTFSKTPCSSRKNSVESLLSSVDSLSDMDFTQEITQGEVDIRRTHTALSKAADENPRQRPSRLKAPSSRKPNEKNEHTKGGRTSSAASEVKKKTNYEGKVKAKVNSLQNIRHMPGGGNAKIFSQKITHLKNVEPRTDTHCVETYSHLPTEFQEIARRLAKQDKQLRSTDGSASGRSRFGKLSASKTLSASATSIASASSTKKTNNPASRTPSIRSRPRAPSLSRSHPATYVTPYDSRSRPSSRPSSRPGSRSSSPNSRSRNSSPVRGNRSRGSSPVGNRRQASTSSRPKSGTSNSHFGSRTARTTSVSDMHLLNFAAPRSVFQVVPAMRK